MENNITNELLEAIAKFQEKCPTIEKDAKGHGYKYASLPQTIERIRPILSEFGLIIMQPISGNGEYISVKTIISHKSGGFISSEVSAPLASAGGRMSQIQACGSIVTYLRRYSLAILGLVTDEDTDGAEVNFQTPKKAKPTKEVFEKMVVAVGKKDQHALDKALNNYELSESQKSQLMEVFNA